MKRWFAFFVLVSVASVSEAEPDLTILNVPAVTLERGGELNEEVRIGDTVTINVRDAIPEAGSDQKLTLALPEGSSSLFEQGFTVRGKFESDASGARFKVAPLKVGDLSLPMLIIKDENGKVVARTKPLQLKVLGVTDQKPPRPPFSPVEVEFPKWVWYAGGGVVFALLLAMVLLAVYLSRRPRVVRTEKPNQKPRLPEDVEAMSALLSLENQKLWEQGLSKKHYFGVSDILKEYLGRRFVYDAEESTTEELLDGLRTREPRDEIVKKVTDLYLVLDRVKFSDFEPQGLEAQSIIGEARKIIDLTKRAYSTVYDREKQGAV